MSNAVKVFKHFESPKQAGEYFRLVCLTGKTKGLAYFLLGKRVVLGRSEKVDIKVLDIKSSREHCEIAKIGKDFILTDLGSQNGVVVNDLKVRQHVLNEGDKIIIGQTVYKFNRLEVKEKARKIELVDEEYEEDEYDDFDETKKSKLTPVLIVIILLAVGVIITSGEDAPSEAKKTKSRYKVQEISGSVAESISKKKKNKKVQDKMNIYFQKGLREFREDNYFRAMSEFEHALSWSPSDPQALFYLRKTKEALDKAIKDLTLKGKRDEDAYKLQNAVVSHCSVLRLLYRYPKDERYLNAQKNVEELEDKLGLEKGDIECQKEIN